jgi:hypothetical protein
MYSLNKAAQTGIEFLSSAEFLSNGIFLSRRGMDFFYQGVGFLSNVGFSSSRRGIFIKWDFCYQGMGFLSNVGYFLSRRRMDFFIKARDFYQMGFFLSRRGMDFFTKAWNFYQKWDFFQGVGFLYKQPTVRSTRGMPVCRNTAEKLHNNFQPYACIIPNHPQLNDTLFTSLTKLDCIYFPN